MIQVALTRQKITDFLLVVHPDPNEKNVPLTFSAPFNVRYAKDNKHCLATLEQVVMQKDAPSRLHISLKIEGEFTVEGVESEEDRKAAHVQCYYRLFPYAQAMITQMSVAAGLNPLVVPPMKMTEESVATKDVGGDAHV